MLWQDTTNVFIFSHQTPAEYHLHVTSLSSVSVFRHWLTCYVNVLGQCTHHKLSIFLVFRLNWFITLSFTITIRVDSKSFYRFKINAAGSLLIVSRVSDTGHGFCPSWSCPARFRSPGSEPRLMRHGAICESGPLITSDGVMLISTPRIMRRFKL